MFSPKVFFSFTEIPKATDHRGYNAWHQLNHRPENLLLPGVLWGERWVRSPDCAATGSAPDQTLAKLHHMNMYWFKEPVDQSTAEWSNIAERSFHWGRRDDVHLANRLLMGFFRPIKGYVNDRVLVSADALPFRPTCGIYLSVTRIDEPRSPEAESLFRGYDRTGIPAAFVEDLALHPGAAEAESTETKLLSCALRTISPRQWDWFDSSM